MQSRRRPLPLLANNVLSEVNSFQQVSFKKGEKRKYDYSNSYKNWQKKSAFFQLPYWKALLLCHNFNVMHIEKNMFDNVIGTMMSIKGKTKGKLGS